MSDADDPPRRPESHFFERRPTFNDIRDDYDEDFGRGRPDTQLVRRRLFVPAIAHICIGATGGTILLLCTLLYAVLYGYGDCDLEEFVLGAGVTIAGIGVFTIVVAGGDAMLRLRRRPLAIYAAFIVAALSFPLFIFGIWALLLLNRREVRQEFERRRVQSQDHKLAEAGDVDVRR